MKSKCCLICLNWKLQLRCTYRAYDAMDEITAAFSVAFNPAGTK